MKKILLLFFILPFLSSAQLKWINVDSLFGDLPPSIHIYKTTDSLDGKPNIAYYVEADLTDKTLEFTTDTTYQRRLKPSQFYEKNNKPLIVVNCTFFSFATNQNLNVVINDGKLLGYNLKLRYGPTRRKGKNPDPKLKDVKWAMPCSFAPTKYKWKMQTAVGGGPVLLQNGDIRMTNNEELKFAGKAIDDKHPRTAMGYTKDNKLIILVIEGRNSGKAEGATLTQEARMLKDLGCREALNLDGGGSSCMLINGAETIKPSDKEGQRPIPAVFIIRAKQLFSPKNCK